MKSLALPVGTICAVLGLAACTSDAGSRPPASPHSSAAPSTTTTTPTPSPTPWEQPSGIAALKLGKIAWTGKQVGVQSMTSLQLSGDFAVVRGATAKGSGGAELAVVRCATGEVVWHLDTHTRFGPAGRLLWTGVDSALTGTSLVALSYHDTATGRDGVAALRVTDRRLEWTRDFSLPSGSHAESTEAQVSAGSAAGVFVELAPFAANNRTPSPESETVALDAGTGRMVWHRKGFLGQKLNGPRLLGITDAGGARWGTPAAVSARDGALLWQLPTDGAQYYRLAVTPSFTLYDAQGNGPHLHDLQVRSNTTGGLVPGPVPDVGLQYGDSDADVLYALGPDGYLLSFAPGDAVPATSVSPIPDAQRTDVFASLAGYVLLEHSRDEVGHTDTTTAYSRSGEPLSSPIPGRVTTITDRYVVTQADGGSGLTVYRRG